ncbi:hypothetical protein BaRGS_00013506, partial [Batillaria attramentaria]
MASRGITVIDDCQRDARSRCRLPHRTNLDVDRWPWTLRLTEDPVSRRLFIYFRSVILTQLLHFCNHASISSRAHNQGRVLQELSVRGESSTGTVSQGREFYRNCQSGEREFYRNCQSGEREFYRNCQSGEREFYRNCQSGEREFYRNCQSGEKEFYRNCQSGGREFYRNCQSGEREFYRNCQSGGREFYRNCQSGGREFYRNCQSGGREFYRNCQSGGKEFYRNCQSGGREFYRNCQSGGREFYRNCQSGGREFYRNCQSGEREFYRNCQSGERVLQELSVGGESSTGTVSQGREFYRGRLHNMAAGTDQIEDLPELHHVSFSSRQSPDGLCTHYSSVVDPWPQNCVCSVGLCLSRGLGRVLDRTVRWERQRPSLRVSLSVSALPFCCLV